MEVIFISELKDIYVDGIKMVDYIIESKTSSPSMQPIVSMVVRGMIAD